MASPSFSPRVAYWSRGFGGGSHAYGWGWRGGPYFHYRPHYRWSYYGGWYGYPWWELTWTAGDWYPSQPNIYYEYPPDTYAQERTLQQQGEIDRLNDEVARLREEREAPAVSQREAPAVREQTELVYRDKHTEEIENYAIVGQTLWIFNEQRARKVALADLDLAATKTANEAHGVEFNLPR